MSEYVRVPRAPTVEMIAATVDAVFGGAIEDASIIAEVYSAMVEAATAGQEPTDADRDYADMRRMQAALIAKTHECNELRALAAEQPQPEAPSGWRMVPVEPTEAMLAAGAAAESNASTHVQERLTLLAYRAMLAAAPPPAAPEPSEAEVAAAMASLYRAMEPAAWPSEDEVTDALRAAAAARKA